MSDYERTFNEFWAELLTNDDGSLNLDQIKRELHDYYNLMDSAAKVYAHVTGGMASKPNNDPSVIIALADDHYRAIYGGTSE